MNRKDRITTLIIIMLMLFSIFSIITPVLASTMQDKFQNNLKEVGGKAYYDEAGIEPPLSDPGEIVANLLYYILSFLGLIFVVLIIISGIQWMTAGGNAEKITKARTRMINAVVGFGLVIMSLAITYGVMFYLQTATSYTY
ncbi:MAG: hypothetical protein COX77_04525 [Candidatus Komeilibacteria bacterium CG_4_10_14_0_2_um_filter_37_10]|uniref:Uncharacterized protein n=1 Tax=Candidatus Komeilibacteria bacterium CG_4_10_14_0_2_um_filter_37_10 TaxID=1974470 RepID=A0A2M7VDG0_9BACT|nr:MAG: hypothetical protein COX77_04525 [Candidatus Komeilibacteria bacterium CG_4_10_14_0_2_um_filter_37_10]PJA92488.1 MAG: hypothetical protein CO133_02950 [Candidatus Komeilibacteria bacterium CG_4_9_14_3_um_filter_37_5]